MQTISALTSSRHLRARTAAACESGFCSVNGRRMRGLFTRHTIMSRTSSGTTTLWRISTSCNRDYYALTWIEGYDHGIAVPSCYGIACVDAWGNVFEVDGFYEKETTD